MSDHLDHRLGRPSWRECGLTLSSNEMFMAAKSSPDDVRPIGIGFTLRKLAASVCLNASQRTFNNEHFGQLQYARKRNGMEEILHLFAARMENDPSLDVFNADGDNAFNLGNNDGSC